MRQSDPGEKTINLITIRAKPRWIAVSLAVALLTAAVPWLTQSKTSAPAIETLAPAPYSPTPSPAPLTQQLPAPDSPASVKPDSARGLGWSLQQIESWLTADAGWYWKSKQRPSDRVGISYEATNIAFPRVEFLIEGLPENLDIFVAKVDVPFSQAQTDQELVAQIAIPVTMVDRVLQGAEKSLAAWVGQCFGDFVKQQQPIKTYERKSGDFRLGLIVARYDNGVLINLMVRR